MPGLGLSSGKSKSSQSSNSSNVNNGALSGSLMPAVGATSQATGLMGNMLNGGPNGYADSGGMNFLLNKGTNTVDSDMSNRGLLNSGADMKGLEDYRSGLASTYLDQYMNHANQMGQLGLGAGGVLARSGDVSSSQGKSKSKNGSISGGAG